MSNRKQHFCDTNKRQSNTLVDKVQKTIERYAMISPEDSLLVGVSGGPDSVALLLLLTDIVKSFHRQKKIIAPKNIVSTPINGINQSIQHQDSNSHIGIAHINHSLRGEESDRDEDFVMQLAEQYNLPCHTFKVDVPAVAKEKRLSFEEAARDVRYSFYREIAEKKDYNKIALGHNSDDNAELVLMNLLRGSGTKGIAGIPPVRDNEIISAIPPSTVSYNKTNCDSNSTKSIKIIRPLIEVSRQDILVYLKLRQHHYMTDSSNDDTTYLRNRIRHSLIPHLKENYNPSVTDSLNRLSQIVMAENSWMEEETEQIFNKSLLYIEKKIFDIEENSVIVGNEVRLDRRAFADKHHALVKRLVRRAIQAVKGDLRRITFNHIDDILQLIGSKSGGTTVHLPDRIRVIKHGQSICFRKESKPLREIGKV